MDHLSDMQLRAKHAAHRMYCDFLNNCQESQDLKNFLAYNYIPTLPFYKVEEHERLSDKLHKRMGAIQARLEYLVKHRPGQLVL